MRPFSFSWLAGRYDRPAADVAVDWSRQRRNGGGIAGTELGNPARSKATREQGWTHTPWLGEGDGECVVSMDATRWRVVDERALMLLRPRLSGASGRQRVGNFAATVVVEDRATLETLIVSVAHKFAHVEQNWGRRTAEVLTWRSNARKWAKKVRRLRRVHPDAEVLLVADWNLDARKQWVRFAVLRVMRKAGKDLRIVAPNGGTHGGRVIDFAVTTLGGHARTEAAKASDHKTVVFKLEEKP